MSIDIQNNTVAINALHDAFAENGLINSKITNIGCFEIEYQLKLPFEALDEFNKFDRQLGEDATCRHNLISSLKHLMNRANNTTKCCTIFRRFFTRQCIMNFTATKKMEGKILLRETNFGVCVIDALVKYYVHTDGIPINNNDALKSAGKATSNAKDWDGRRRPLPKQ